MKTRFLLVRRGCPICRMFIKEINMINLVLPPDKKIEIIDCYRWEEFGIKIPLMEKLEKDGLSEGFPFFYIDGVVVDVPPTREQLRIILKNFLKDELII